jgi:YD repeat-containing protein
MNQSIIFNWVFSDQQGRTQQAYEVQIFKKDGTLLIGSGKMNSTASKHITPSSLFEVGEEYFWKVKVWNDKGLESEASADMKLVIKDLKYIYEYDLNGRLVNIKDTQNNRIIIKYTYDTNGNLISKVRQ